MTASDAGLFTEEVCELVNRYDAIAAKVQPLWRWDIGRLRSAKVELEVDFEMFLADLDASPVFSQMPQFEDDYEILWAMLLKWGEPGTDVWNDEAMAGSSLRALPLDGFLVALAAMNKEAAISCLLYYAMNCGTKDRNDGVPWLVEARRYIQGAEKALAFVEGCC